ncbi:MAG: hypothetical protein J4G16_11935 [Acidobacteria bacterium]|nr:hypothetical protein [Acidobacteriota bacterium]
MKRIIVLAAVIGAGVLSLGIVAAQDAMVIEVEQLEDNLYVLRGQGGGGNTAVFVTSDGRTRAGASRSWTRSASSPATR